MPSSSRAARPRRQLCGGEGGLVAAASPRSPDPRLSPDLADDRRWNQLHVAARKCNFKEVSLVVLVQGGGCGAARRGWSAGHQYPTVATRAKEGCSCRGRPGDARPTRLLC